MSYMIRTGAPPDLRLDNTSLPDSGRIAGSRADLSRAELLIQADPATSSWPFVRQLMHVDLGVSQECGQKLRPVRNAIIRTPDKTYGYLSSSQGYDQNRELLAAALTGKFFSERAEGTIPLYVPIDEFYRFFPNNASLVSKVLRFHEECRQCGDSRQYALILTGFTASTVFTEAITQAIPQQKEAGLSGSDAGTDETGTMLLRFGTDRLSRLLESTRGDVDAARIQIAREAAQEDDARLLLATGLLLQDRQSWQSLWGEAHTNGMLCLVAPGCFHDAMNRLNAYWGHGGCDYRHRATLGHFEDPPLGDSGLTEERSASDHEGGLSRYEFRTRVGPLLMKLASAG